MTISANYPSIRPSLLLDFANGKALDPRITFSRPTTARYYDANTSAIAEQNLLLYSQDFSNAVWGTGGGTTTLTSGQTAPDASSTATLLTAAATNNFHIVGSSAANYGGNGTFTVSAFLKAGTNNFASLSCSNSAGSAYAAITVNFSGTPAITQTGSTGFTYQSSTITQLGGAGWYRVTLTFISNANFFVHISLNNTATPTYGTYGLQTWNAAGTETIVAWGTQLENRSAATAYTLTTTAFVTNYIPVLLSAASNVPRFDHNPTTRESLGLLIEEQRTNLLTYSEQFDTLWGINNATITSNTIVAPDGTISGDTITTSTGGGYVDRGANAANLTLSIYVKRGVGNLFSIGTNGASGADFAVFNLATPAVVSTGANNVSASINPVGNNWYRLVVTRGATAGSAVYFGFLTSGASANDFHYIWGAQMEAGAFPTSYIPTVASQVTRSADSASMTGTNFSSWYRTDQGTLYTELVETFDTTALASNSGGVSINANSAQPCIEITVRGNDFSLVARGVGGGASSISLPAVLATRPAGTASKIAMTYTVDVFGSITNGAVNGLGATNATKSANPITGINQLDIGKQIVSGTTIGTRTFKKVAYYPTAVTLANLQALTGS